MANLRFKRVVELVFPGHEGCSWEYLADLGYHVDGCDRKTVPRWVAEGRVIADRELILANRWSHS